MYLIYSMFSNNVKKKQEVKACRGGISRSLIIANANCQQKCVIIVVTLQTDKSETFADFKRCSLTKTASPFPFGFLLKNLSVFFRNSLIYGEFSMGCAMSLIYWKSSGGRIRECILFRFRGSHSTQGYMPGH